MKYGNIQFSSQNFFSGMCFSLSSKREINDFKISLSTVTLHTTRYVCGCVFWEDGWEVSIIPTGDNTAYTDCLCTE